jgi:hypothetical protein
MQQNLCKYGVFHAIRRISYDTALLHIRGSVADGAGVLFLFSKKNLACKEKLAGEQQGRRRGGSLGGREEDRGPWDLDFFLFR